MGLSRKFLRIAARLNTNSALETKPSIPKNKRLINDNNRYKKPTVFTFSNELNKERKKEILPRKNRVQ